jgi:hypothetical protein
LPEEPIVDQSALLTHQTNVAAPKEERKIKPFLGNISAF